MAGPAPHEGPCKRAGDGAEHDDDVCKLGRYRGLCGICRPIVAAEQKASRTPPQPERTPQPRDDLDGMRDEIKARSDQRGKLKLVCQELVAKADLLEDALEKRNLARIHAQSAVHDFKEALQLVGRVAQSLVNVRAEPPDS